VTPVADAAAAVPPAAETVAPAVELVGAELSYDDRTLWSGLDLALRRGQFVAVLGPNGSGKTSLLKVLLGLTPLTAGSARVMGERVRRGNRRVGYISQHSGFDWDLPLRGRDLVGLGMDGHRWGVGSAGRRRRARIDALLDEVGARAYGKVRIGQLSGGEQQRLRVAQALATDPDVLLCDEPLVSLDLHHQRSVVELLDRRRRDHDTAVVFVTHEINPILAVTDLVLYIIDGTFRLGTPDEVMTTEVLSELYGSHVEVIRRAGRIIVVGAEDMHQSHHDRLDPRTPVELRR
jgi:zinc/manganese transport system ATP-binding protein